MRADWYGLPWAWFASNLLFRSILKPNSLLPALRSGFRLSDRSDFSFGRTQVVGGRNQNLNPANASRDRNDIEQFHRLVYEHRRIALGRKSRHPAANVA